jgi:ankyrin repeat protein
MALEKFPLHEAAAAGNLAQLEKLLARPRRDAAAEIERVTPDGLTALMLALLSPKADVTLVEKLIAAGADIHRRGEGAQGTRDRPVTVALRAGDVRKVDALVRAGADIHYSRDGYTALLDGIHGRSVSSDQGLLDLIRYLIGKGVDLDSETKYSETALRVLSRLGRFDAIRLLLEAGANEEQLAWTPLIRAVAFGEAREVEALLKSGADLEARDYWQRTAWLVAIAAGRIDIADSLHRAGVDIQAAGRCAKPPLFYAIEAGNLRMLEWLLEIGCDAQAIDQFGNNALMTAADEGFTQAIDPLLRSGIDVNATSQTYTALGSATRADVARKLLDAGADPAEITSEARRSFLGLSPNPSVHFLDIRDDEFRRGAARRFGKANPEEIEEPFWTAMIRAGVNAYQAASTFASVKVRHPVWCAQRFGQSISFLPDGRIVQIGGEHEDYYDEDFCIYNDVFVHEPDGRVRVFGYPEKVFPPTDFHTATLLGRKLILIGSLGYPGARKPGATPVYSLDTDNYRIEKVRTFGTGPGWISRHRAHLLGSEIVVSGGKVAVEANGEEDYVDNGQRFALDIEKWRWRKM